MKVVYRVVNAVLGALVFVASFFLDFFYVRIGTGENLKDVIETISKDKTSGVAIAETFSIKRFIDIYNGKDTLSALLKFDHDKSFLWPKEFYSLNTRLIIFLAAFALVLAAGLFIIIWSCCSAKRIPVLAAGILGIILVVTMICTLNSVSKDLYEGKVNVIDYVIDSLLGEGIVSMLLGSTVTAALVFYITLAGVQNGLLFIFIGVVIWTAIYYLVEWGDPKAKEEKERALAEKAEKKRLKAEKKSGKKAKAES